MDSASDNARHTLCNVTESDWPSYLRAAMKAANGMSQADLTRASGVSDGTVSKWLAGTVQPTIPQLRRLVPVFKIPILTLAVAAGHFTPKEANMRDAPAPPVMAVGDPVEAEIRAAGYTPEVEKMLLKIRQDNRLQVQELISALQKDGVLKAGEHAAR